MPLLLQGQCQKKSNDEETVRVFENNGLHRVRPAEPTGVEPGNHGKITPTMVRLPVRGLDLIFLHFLIKIFCIDAGDFRCLGDNAVSSLQSGLEVIPLKPFDHRFFD